MYFQNVKTIIIMMNRLSIVLQLVCYFQMILFGESLKKTDFTLIFTLVIVHFAITPELWMD